jgi:hypothetical protein
VTKGGGGGEGGREAAGKRNCRMKKFCGMLTLFYELNKINQYGDTNTYAKAIVNAK